MREIKFRGMSEITGHEWVYGNLHIDYKSGDMWVGKEAPYEPIIRETVGQYTGLNDRKGNPIYEGDILEDFDGEKWEMITVKYDNGKFEAMFLDESIEDLCAVCDGMTIVGNIYDNPELWEGGKI